MEFSTFSNLLIDPHVRNAAGEAWQIMRAVARRWEWEGLAAHLQGRVKPRSPEVGGEADGVPTVACAGGLIPGLVVGRGEGVATQRIRV